MKKLFSTLILFALLFACQREELPEKSASCDYSGPNGHPRSDVFQALIEGYVEEGLPGITLLVRDGDGKWVGSAGKANIEKGEDMAPCHVSKVASITKIMMGTLALQLVEEGELSLDARVGELLEDEWTEDVGNAGKARVQQLMNHRSGIYDVVSDQGFYLDILDKPDREWTSEELLDHVRNKDPEFGVGAGEKYSNTNFTYLSLILEEVTGKEHEALLRERLIDPLGLDATYYDPHDKLPERTAHGYYDLHNEGSIVDLTDYSTGNGNGYTGIYSTVDDLQRFIEALYRTETLLNASTLDRMLTFKGEEEGGRKFGLACYKDYLGHENFAYGHRGRDLAYSADAFYFPERDITICFLVNYGTNGESELKGVFEDFREELGGVVL